MESRPELDKAEIKVAGPESMLGVVIDDRYEIVDVIGTGGMAWVFKVKHLELEPFCAVKILVPESYGPVQLKRFQQEARLIAALDHPNVIKVKSIGIIGDRPFIVMEYIDGTSLSEHIRAHGALDRAQALSVFRQICKGLSVAHARGIVHRDLKPSNIMLERTGIVKILDFGIARSESNKQQHLTQTGAIIGSPEYMSPEQCAGKEIDSRSDIYSLGCLMYEALTGVPPFHSESELLTMAKHLHDLPLDSTLLSQSPDLREIIFRCLEKDPAKRFQTVDDLLAQLQQTSTKNLFVDNKFLPGGRSLGWIALAVSVLVIGAGTIFVFNKNEQRNAAVDVVTLSERSIDPATLGKLFRSPKEQADYVRRWIKQHKRDEDTFELMNAHAFLIALVVGDERVQAATDMENYYRSLSSNQKTSTKWKRYARTILCWRADANRNIDLNAVPPLFEQALRTKFHVMTNTYDYRYWPDAKIWELLGGAQNVLGKSKESVSAYRKAATLYPPYGLDWIRVRCNIADALKLEKPAEALALANESWTAIRDRVPESLTQIRSDDESTYFSGRVSGDSYGRILLILSNVYRSSGDLQSALRTSMTRYSLYAARRPGDQLGVQDLENSIKDSCELLLDTCKFNQCADFISQAWAAYKLRESNLAARVGMLDYLAKTLLRAHLPTDAVPYLKEIDSWKLSGVYEAQRQELWACYYRELHQYPEAFAHFDKALAISPAPEQRAGILLDKLQTYQQVGKPDEAQLCFDQIAKFDGPSRGSLLLNGGIHLAEAYRSKGLNDRALSVIEEALKAASLLKDNNAIQHLYLSRALVYGSTGKYGAALQDSNRCYDILVKLGKDNTVQLLQVGLQGSSFMFRDRKTGEANARLESLVRKAKQANNRDILIYALQACAEQAFSNYQNELSLKFSRELLACAEKPPVHAEVVADAYRLISSSLAAQHDRSAIEYIEKSLSAYRSLKLDKGLLDGLRYAGEANMALNRFDEASANLREAITIAAKINERRLRRELYCKLAYALMGGKRHKEAVPVLLKSVELYEEEPGIDSQDLISLLNLTGENYVIMSDFNSAMPYHERAFKLANENKLSPEYLYVYAFNLGRDFVGAENYDEAARLYWIAAENAVQDKNKRNLLRSLLNAGFATAKQSKDEPAMVFFFRKLASEKINENVSVELPLIARHYSSLLQRLGQKEKAEQVSRLLESVK